MFTNVGVVENHLFSGSAILVFGPLLDTQIHFLVQLLSWSLDRSSVSCVVWSVLTVFIRKNIQTRWSNRPSGSVTAIKSDQDWIDFVSLVLYSLSLNFVCVISVQSNLKRDGRNDPDCTLIEEAGGSILQSLFFNGTDCKTWFSCRNRSQSRSMIKSLRCSCALESKCRREIDQNWFPERVPIVSRAVDTVSMINKAYATIVEREILGCRKKSQHFSIRSQVAPNEIKFGTNKLYRKKNKIKMNHHDYFRFCDMKFWIFRFSEIFL